MAPPCRACMLPDLTREQALHAVEQPDASARLAWLAPQRVGRNRPDGRRRSPGEHASATPTRRVRTSASQAMWRIWSRSGDSGDRPLVRARPAADAGLRLRRRVGHVQRDQCREARAGGSLRSTKAANTSAGRTITSLSGEHVHDRASCDDVSQRKPRPFRRPVRRRSAPRPPASASRAARAVHMRQRDGVVGRICAAVSTPLSMVECASDTSTTRVAQCQRAPHGGVDAELALQAAHHQVLDIARSQQRLHSV